MKTYEPIPKPHRVVDPKAIQFARLPWCEVCGKWDVTHVHHIKTRGSGGNDEAHNLISVCPICHDRIHRGLILAVRNHPRQ